MKRFWDKVAINGLVNCWEWLAGCDSSGYGNVWYHGRNEGAHRVAYKKIIGNIPKDLELDHICRNRKCVNPYHLEPVTHRENVMRGAVPKTHCVRGHPRTPENLTRNRCRECMRMHNRAARIRKKKQCKE